MKKLRSFLFVIALSAVSVVATSRCVLAYSIDFFGGPGGSISYGGGSSPLTGSGLPIFSVWGTPPGLSSMYSITGGAMGFSTGGYSGVSPLGGYMFGTGGSLNITGGISGLLIGGGSTLMEASFSSAPTFKYKGFGVWQLSAGLSISSVHESLLGAYGFPSGATGIGALYQLDVYLDPSYWPFGPEVPFTAYQGLAYVTSTLALPEPGTLLLLGSGLTVFGLIGIRGSRSKKMEETDAISRLA